MTRNIVILYADAGGGHRSAAEAISEALTSAHGPAARVTLVDGLKHYAPFPFNVAWRWYPPLSGHRRVWEIGYRLSDGEARTRLASTLFWPYVRAAMRRLLAEHPADVYVSVHALYMTPLLRALGRPRPPVVTVVTDMVSIHAWWCHPHVDLCIVVTDGAKERAIRHGVPTAKVRVTGLPVAHRFCAPSGGPAELRAKLGWGADRPAVLMVGGGDGMGPLFEIAQAVSRSGLRCELAVVAGRNERLRRRLEAARWDVPAHIYGFVTDMPDLMRAADVIVTKAGPGTINEAWSAGLPIILYDYLPGQETGNVTYVVENGAGVFAPNPAAVVDALRAWIGPEAPPGAQATVAVRSRELARPDAARRAADLIWDL
jgi:1,2-diacylglycerol 3-beta-galactosyltransferase